MATLPLQPRRIAFHTSAAALPVAYALGWIPRPVMLAAAVGLVLVYVPLDLARLAWPAWNHRVFVLFGPFTIT